MVSLGRPSSLSCLLNPLTYIVSRQSAFIDAIEVPNGCRHFIFTKAWVQPLERNREHISKKGPVSLTLDSVGTPSGKKTCTQTRMHVLASFRSERKKQTRKASKVAIVSTDTLVSFMTPGSDSELEALWTDGLTLWRFRVTRYSSVILRGCFIEEVGLQLLASLSLSVLHILRRIIEEGNFNVSLPTVRANLHLSFDGKTETYHHLYSQQCEQHGSRSKTTTETPHYSHIVMFSTRAALGLNTGKTISTLSLVWHTRWKWLCLVTLTIIMTAKQQSDKKTQIWYCRDFFFFFNFLLND